MSLVFIPGKIVPGKYHFDVGTAGNTTLVLQTLLPLLIHADAPSISFLRGGTHNPFASPYEFISQSFIPLLKQMGANISIRLERIGFAPVGDGEVSVKITPVKKLKTLKLLERGKIFQQYAHVLLSHLPEHIAFRELKICREKLHYQPHQLLFTPCNEASGPGNVVMVTIHSKFITSVFTAFGRRGKRAEAAVARQVAEEVLQYLNSGVPVDAHLADQLLIPLALAGRGLFLTQQPSLHSLTNMNVIKDFMNLNFCSEEISKDVWKISLS